MRDASLILTSVLLELVGIEWLLGFDLLDFKFASLVIRLACVEIRVVLENVSIPSESHFISILNACYTILAVTIDFLSNEDDEQVLEIDWLLKLRDELIAVFESILMFTIQVISVNDDAMSDSLVISTLHLLLKWISQEASVLVDEIKQILPYLLDLWEPTYFFIFILVMK
jgi:hypothetical protein